MFLFELLFISPLCCRKNYEYGWFYFREFK